jgi:putative mRNA 3-end processing factor
MINANNLRISLDRRSKGSDLDFISHAHADHISSAKSTKHAIASEETVALLKKINDIELKHEKTPDFMQLYDAGHILGSKQIAINDEVSGRRILYTGDFQLQNGRACKKLQITGADTIIVDSTYFDPRIKFDERSEVEIAIQKWTQGKLRNGIALFSTFALGKAQELIMILNEVGIVPVVSEKIARINEVYAHCGLDLDYIADYEDGAEYIQLLKENFVGITDGPGDQIRACVSEAYGKRVYSAVATGFSKVMKFNTDVQFSLSDHADFWQAYDYIGMTGAKNVLTYGPNAVQMAINLSRNGCGAEPYAEAAVTQQMATLIK